ncbi:MAG: hypothetical protein CM15mP106_7220 [Candidatus Neomarinimicrobiota bacterium]|nr:MAG: hypothetical protein CM15mP106_7220 [Candidatus Neomarinimicrobiota bacterium]
MGKKGTAENSHGEDHAWFIGWMKYYEKNFSIVVLFRKLRFRGAVAPNCKNIFDKIIIYENNNEFNLNK